MTFEILCDAEDRAFRPGDTISGRVRWSCDEIPQWIEFRLFYYTEGKGTQDIGVVQEMRLTDNNLSGEKPFSFTAPGHPSSCSGKLVSIRWALELVSNLKEIIPRVDIVIAPDAKELQLGATK